MAILLEQVRVDTEGFEKTDECSIRVSDCTIRVS